VVDDVGFESAVDPSPGNFADDLAEIDAFGKLGGIMLAEAAF
jgi:hypothetical protein